MSERSGLTCIRDGFPQLRHIELSGCDHISSYEAMLPIFEKHSALLSLRATFEPRATAGIAFSQAVPRTLVSLGFINFETPEALTVLLDRCALEHLWLSAHGNFSHAYVNAMSTKSNAFKTLSLPSTVSEDSCLAVAKVCPDLELLCRMRIGNPAFGSDSLAENFEVLPESQGVVVRKRGSNAQLAVNGCMWAPYSQSDRDLPSLPGPTTLHRAVRPVSKMTRPSVEFRISFAAQVAESAAAAVTDRRSQRRQGQRRVNFAEGLI